MMKHLPLEKENKSGISRLVNEVMNKQRKHACSFQQVLAEANNESPYILRFQIFRYIAAHRIFKLPMKGDILINPTSEVSKTQSGHQSDLVQVQHVGFLDLRPVYACFCTH